MCTSQGTRSDLFMVLLSRCRDIPVSVLVPVPMMQFFLLLFDLWLLMPSVYSDELSHHSRKMRCHLSTAICLLRYVHSDMNVGTP
jgi:hypothetical protein